MEDIGRKTKRLRLEKEWFSISEKGVEDLFHSKKRYIESFDKGSKITWWLLADGLGSRNRKHEDFCFQHVEFERLTGHKYQIHWIGKTKS